VGSLAPALIGFFILKLVLPSSSDSGAKPVPE